MSAFVMVAEGNPVSIDGSCTPAPAPAPRRPRVREVSSRFMSPSVSISSSSLSGDLHMISNKSPMHKHKVRSGSAQRQRNPHEIGEVLESGDEKENIENRFDFGGSFENQFKGTPGGFKFKKQQRAAVKLFKENNETPKRRPDTPIVSTTLDKNVLKKINSGSATPAAVRQLKLGGMPSSAQSSTKIVASDDCESSSMKQTTCSRDSIVSDTSSVESSSCSNSPMLIQKCRTPRPSPNQIHSSMPESCMPITVSSRYLGDRTGSRGLNGSSTKMAASTCCRSLNMSIPSSILSNGNNLPPHPPAAKAGMESKSKKVNTQQEGIHSLKLLHNRYLQWRFSNAQAEAAIHSQTQDAERMLYTLSIKILDMRKSVMRKRIELAFLRRSKIVFYMLDAHMPQLDCWSIFEDQFATCLSELTNALLNASVQLPIGRNIKIDLKGFREALSSAFKVMEMIESQISGFFHKATEMDKLLLELARVNIVERNYIEESGHLLSKTRRLQVDKCSSKAQLIQLQQRSLS